MTVFVPQSLTHKFTNSLTNVYVFLIIVIISFIKLYKVYITYFGPMDILSLFVARIAVLYKQKRMLKEKHVLLHCRQRGPMWTVLQPINVDGSWYLY